MSAAMGRYCRMNYGRAIPAPLCVAASLLLQGCVEYIPENGYPAGSPAAPPQNYAPPTAPPAPPPAPVQSPMEALLAPIALYPDPLIALILPASTFPEEISAASAYLVQYGDPTRIDSQPWDPSVRALAHYPTVITWMADNMAWTQALGSAFASSPSGVMAAIQSLRARAMASGALAPTPQEQVYSDDGDIEIVPAQPDVVYVPAYDTGVVYSDIPYVGYAGPFMDFGQPYPAGVWLSYCLDWQGHSIWVAGPNAWRGPGGWHRPPFDAHRAPPGARPWHPPAGAPRTSPLSSAGPVPTPRPMPGAPTPPPPRSREAGSPGQDPRVTLSHPMGQAPALPAKAPAPNAAHAEPSRAVPESRGSAPVKASDSKDRDPGK
jgi:hypothetical protein